ncbi:hypothetical protein [Streptomyces sp. NPDC058579]|uniref:hypothetical protein n=1 Tax=Streptomyces sp. NPDC058579 TaxID=3346548 RepID=UPI003646ABA3
MTPRAASRATRRTTARRRPPTLRLSLFLSPFLALAAVSCGVQPSGVIGAGEPPTGLTKGLRLYYVSGSGNLEGVSRPDLEITELGAALKLLVAGPTEPEQERGLTTLVSSISYQVTGEATRVTLRSPGSAFSGTRRDDLVNGQLVCTLARAQSVLHPRIHPDDVEVTLVGDGEPVGPYRCSQFMGGS